MPESRDHSYDVAEDQSRRGSFCCARHEWITLPCVSCTPDRVAPSAIYRCKRDRLVPVSEQYRTRVIRIHPAGTRNLRCNLRSLTSRSSCRLRANIHGTVDCRSCRRCHTGRIGTPSPKVPSGSDSVRAVLPCENNVLRSTRSRRSPFSGRIRTTSFPDRR